jgi:hypothetical protein
VLVALPLVVAASLASMRVLYAHVVAFEENGERGRKRDATASAVMRLCLLMMRPLFALLRRDS